MKHEFYTDDDISDTDSWGQTNIVDGGLCVCKVCHGMEGALTTDCPGEMVAMERHDEVYAGKIDYREGMGWVPELNPTNQTWERAARLRAAWDNGVSCYGKYGSYEIPPECCVKCASIPACKEDTLFRGVKL